ncbi:hypothetical protein ACIBCT_13095 [Streptosporangium sp. NPDC050855]|uniref:hypothetical protein n=1 Tax=Streptosporangium sp. NPDC050855 TaxID=3366194 RepID=UPI003796C7FE
MNFCLSDLVPPLRWSDAATIPLLRDQPDLPDAWWRSLPVARVLAVLGPERLAEILTEIALKHWPAAAVGDVLPALHVLDPEDADEPCTAIALDRAGSWPGLLALTGHDLRDQPFIQPVPLLHTLFAAVLTRLTASAPSADVAVRPAPVRDVQEAQDVREVLEPGSVRDRAAFDVSRTPESRTAVETRAVEGPKVQAIPDAPEALKVADTPDTPDAAEIPNTPDSVNAPEPPDAPQVPDAPETRAASDASEALPHGAEVEAASAAEALRDRRAEEAEEDAAPGSLFRPAAARRSRSEAGSTTGHGPRTAPEDAPETGVTGPEPGDVPVAGSPLTTGPPAGHVAETGEPASGTGPQDEPEAEHADPDGTRDAPEDRPEDRPEDQARDRLDDRPLDQADDRLQDRADDPAQDRADDQAGDEAESRAHDRHGDRADDDLVPDAVPHLPRDASEPGDEASGPVSGDEPGTRATDLHALVDGVFADAEDRRWAVAQNRLFSDVPATVEALAKLFAVSPDVIRDLETDLRRELAEWIASDEAAPYREHLESVKDLLGKAAPRERLINAADWHTRELRSLDVPAWQFVLASLPEYHVVDEWLVEGDITELRHRTRDMISAATPPLTINKALDMVSSLGIHPEVSKEWLENVPQLRILGAGERPPQRGGAPSLTAEKPGDGAGDRLGGDGGAEGRNGGGADGHKAGEPAKAPFRPLKDVSLTRRCFRQPDGRWWLRIDVTADHLRGAECPLPSGFAAYLGMAPGVGRTVSSAVGELALNWQDRPVLESLGTLLADVGAKEGSHLFLTLSDEGVLRARHLPAAGDEVETTARALRLVGYTAAGGTPEQAVRVIATRVGMGGPAALPDLLTRLRERGDRDLLALLA